MCQWRGGAPQSHPRLRGLRLQPTILAHALPTAAARGSWRCPSCKVALPELQGGGEAAAQGRACCVAAHATHAASTLSERRRRCGGDTVKQVIELWRSYGSYNDERRVSGRSRRERKTHTHTASSLKHRPLSYSSQTSHHNGSVNRCHQRACLPGAFAESPPPPRCTQHPNHDRDGVNSTASLPRVRCLSHRPH